LIEDRYDSQRTGDPPMMTITADKLSAIQRASRELRDEHDLVV
jgi:hypothetical protein